MYLYRLEQVLARFRDWQAASQPGTDYLSRRDWAERKNNDKRHGGETTKRSRRRKDCTIKPEEEGSAPNQDSRRPGCPVCWGGDHSSCCQSRRWSEQYRSPRDDVRSDGHSGREHETDGGGSSPPRPDRGRFRAFSGRLFIRGCGGGGRTRKSGCGIECESQVETDKVDQGREVERVRGREVHQRARRKWTRRSRGLLTLLRRRRGKLAPAVEPRNARVGGRWEVSFAARTV